MQELPLLFSEYMQVQLVLIPASQNIQNRTPTSISVEPSAGPATEIAAVQAQKAKATRYRARQFEHYCQQEKEVLTEPPKPII